MSTTAAASPSPAPRATSERLLTPQDDESLIQHVARSTKNFFISCFGCIQTSDEKAKIKYHQYLIETRKKAFGVEYVNLLRAKAPQSDLDACLEKCLKDIGRIDEDIAELNAVVDKVTGETKSKIAKPPAKAATATTTAASTTSASTTAASTTATAPTSANTAAPAAPSPAPSAPADAAPTGTTTPATTSATTPAEAPAPATADSAPAAAPTP
jgi:hypothetical protein